MKKLSVIVPTFNEGENVKPLYEGVRDALKGIPFELLFVDDSVDDTPDRIRALQENAPEVRLIHRDTDKGLSSAVIRGFAEAEGEFLAVMDGDLQHPPKLLRPMVRCMEEGFDLCLPSRFVPGGSDGGLNIIRKFVSWTARKCGNISLRSLRKFSDVTGGYFMLRRGILEGAELKPLGWKILVEVLAMTRYEKVCEIPYTFEERNAGTSKISMKVTLEYLQQLRELRHREVRKPAVSITVKSPKEVADLEKE